MRKNILIDIFKENPVFVYLLGIVPVLGTTLYLKTALVMGSLTFFVLFMSNILVCFIREYTNKHNELFIYIIATAVFTTIADVFISFINIEMHEILGIYIPLITVNCLILSNLCVSSSKKNMKEATTDSSVMGISFVFAIALVGMFREFLGNGTVFEYEIIPNNIPRVLISQTSAGGFFILALICILVNSFRKEKA